MSIVTLKEGDNAPDFSGKDQNGNTVSLADFKGKRDSSEQWFRGRDSV